MAMRLTFTLETRGWLCICHSASHLVLILKTFLVGNSDYQVKMKDEWWFLPIVVNWWCGWILLTSWVFSSWFKDALILWRTTEQWITVKLLLKHVLGQLVSLFLCPGWEEQQEVCMSHRTKTQNLIPKRVVTLCLSMQNWIGEVSSLFKKFT